MGQFVAVAVQVRANRRHSARHQLCRSLRFAFFAVKCDWVCWKKLRDLILALETQLKVLEQQLVQRLQGQERPKGLGELHVWSPWTARSATGHAFDNPSRSAATPGCCPGEHSSGGKRRVGAIDRDGPTDAGSCAAGGQQLGAFLKWQPQLEAAPTQ